MATDDELMAWAPKPTAPTGIALAGYSDFRLVAQGGEGTVYRARQVGLGRDVAVKVLEARDDTALARFRRELEITVRLGRQHPHIVTVLDTGVVGGRPCIVMEFHDLGSLHDRLRARGPLPVTEVVAAGIAVADALAFAHAQGVLHRDVKPQNVLALPTSYVLADFGIARAVDAGHSASLQLVSYRHAAPQMVDGEKPAAADDLWSLGSTLFTLLDGAPPFASRDADDSMLGYLGRVRSGQPRALLRPDVPPALAAIIDRCLAKAREDRFPDAASLRAALAGVDTAWAPTPSTVDPDSTRAVISLAPPQVYPEGPTALPDFGPRPVADRPAPAPVAEEPKTWADQLADLTVRHHAPEPEVPDFGPRPADSDQPPPPVQDFSPPPDDTPFPDAGRTTHLDQDPGPHPTGTPVQDPGLHPTGTPEHAVRDPGPHPTGTPVQNSGPHPIGTPGQVVQGHGPRPTDTPVQGRTHPDSDPRPTDTPVRDRTAHPDSGSRPVDAPVADASGAARAPRAADTDFDFHEPVQPTWEVGPPPPVRVAVLPGEPNTQPTFLAPLDDRVAKAPSKHRLRWLVPLAVVAVIGGAVLGMVLTGPPPDTQGAAPASSSAPAPIPTTSDDPPTSASVPAGGDPRFSPALNRVEVLGPTNVELDWTDPSDGKAQFVLVDVTGKKPEPLVTVTAGTTTHVLEGLDTARRYCFQVLAIGLDDPGTQRGASPRTCTTTG